jgi:hypothetical protein
VLEETYRAAKNTRTRVGAAEGCDLLILLLPIVPTQSVGTIKQDQKIAAFGSSYRELFEAGISVLGFVIQGGVEVGALLQVFLGIALGVGFFAGDFNVGAGWQHHGGGDGGSGNHGEEIEVHGGNPRVRLACLPGWAVKQT